MKNFFMFSIKHQARSDSEICLLDSFQNRIWWDYWTRFNDAHFEFPIHMCTDETVRNQKSFLPVGLRRCFFHMLALLITMECEWRHGREFGIDFYDSVEICWSTLQCENHGENLELNFHNLKTLNCDKIFAQSPHKQSSNFFHLPLIMSNIKFLWFSPKKKKRKSFLLSDLLMKSFADIWKIFCWCWFRIRLGRALFPATEAVLSSEIKTNWINITRNKHFTVLIICVFCSISRNLRDASLSLECLLWDLFLIDDACLCLSAWVSFSISIWHRGEALSLNFNPTLEIPSRFNFTFHLKRKVNSNQLNFPLNFTPINDRISFLLRHSR